MNRTNTNVNQNYYESLISIFDHSRLVLKKLDIT